jgi:hypothetical protein
MNIGGDIMHANSLLDAIIALVLQITALIALICYAENKHKKKENSNTEPISK